MVKHRIGPLGRENHPSHATKHVDSKVRMPFFFLASGDSLLIATTKDANREVATHFSFPFFE